MSTSLLNSAPETTPCTVCYGLGRRERLIQLRKPKLDVKGRLVKYLIKKETCELCQGKGVISHDITVL